MILALVTSCAAGISIAPLERLLGSNRVHGLPSDICQHMPRRPAT